MWTFQALQHWPGWYCRFSGLLSDPEITAQRQSLSTLKPSRERELLRALASWIPAVGEDSSTLNPISQERGWRETLEEMEDKRRYQRGWDEIAGIKVGLRRRGGWGKKHTPSDTQNTDTHNQRGNSTRDHKWNLKLLWQLEQVGGHLCLLNLQN